MPDVPNYRVGPCWGTFICNILDPLKLNSPNRTPVRRPLYVPDAPNNGEGPQAREPSERLSGQSYREDWPERPSGRLREAGEKTLTGHNSCSGGRPCSCTVGATRVPTSQAAAPPSCSALTGAELPQAKETCMCAHVHLSSAQLFATLQAVPFQASLSQGFSRQEYWSVLANT